MSPPATPKIYHILHVDRLASIVADGALWCDAMLQEQVRPGTIIGMNTIKGRRLTAELNSHRGLCVGDCVPFYFCPRSVMLYVIQKANHPDLAYRGGQSSILHLEADLHEVIDWAEREGRRWAFTLSNAGSRYFEDRCSLARLVDINWNAVRAQQWSGCKEQKQAEFLVERSFPWTLVRSVGAPTPKTRDRAAVIMRPAPHRPAVLVRPSWYY